MRPATRDSLLAPRIKFNQCSLWGAKNQRTGKFCCNHRCPVILFNSLKLHIWVEVGVNNRFDIQCAWLEILNTVSRRHPFSLMSKGFGKVFGGGKCCSIAKSGNGGTLCAVRRLNRWPPARKRRGHAVEISSEFNSARQCCSHESAWTLNGRQTRTEHGCSVQKFYRVGSNFISGNGATREMGIVCRFGLASSDKPIYNSLAIDSVVMQALKRDLASLVKPLAWNCQPGSLKLKRSA